MSDFTRYAVYYLPSGPLAEFGARWLGWDIDGAAAVAQPQVKGFDIAAATAAPRKYGFHATMKAPFRLAPPHGEVELQSALADLVDALLPVALGPLALTRIGQFIALTATGNPSGINAIAAACVTELDGFRNPAPPQETARRRAAGLSPRQEHLLAKWGYPHVMDCFRFHMTLTGKLDAAVADQAFDAILQEAGDLLDHPQTLDCLALVGERQDGQFQTIHRFTLSD